MLQLKLQGIECSWAALEQTIHELDLVEFVVPQHSDEARILHPQQGCGMVLDVFLEELVYHLVVGGWVQVAVDSVLLFVEASVGFGEVVVAGILGDVVVGLVSVVVPGLLNEKRFKLLLIYPLRLHPDLNEHFYYFL